MSTKYKMPSYNAKDGYFEQKSIVYSSFIRSEERNLKIGDYTKLYVYVTLPIRTGGGNDYVVTDHEIKLKKE